MKDSNKVKSPASKQTVRVKVNVRAAGTYVGVFGHGVKLEEQRALNDLTHLMETKNIRDECSGSAYLTLLTEKE